MFGRGIWFFLAVVAPVVAAASLPEFKALRFDEDYSAYRDPLLRSTPGAALKFIPLSPPADAYLTVGGELRLRYEFFRHQLWGQGPQDRDGYWLSRTMLHLDAHAGRGWRAFVQLKSGLEHGRAGGPRSTDEDRLDWHQAFIDRTWLGSGDNSFVVRLGRQELAYGSSRLISFRESPNVRLAFDGLRASWRHAATRIDGFAAAPAETDPGAFDDATDRTKKLWGLYVTTPVPGLSGMKLDLYYLGLKRDRAVFSQGSGREERHSVGARIWGQAGRLDYNWEALGQTGKFGDGNIQAWTVASDQGISWPAAPGRPRVGLRANLSSGDRSGGARDLQTFNPLFPRGAYFSEMGLLGPANLTDLHPSITLQPAAGVTVALDWDFIWRTTAGDGLYGPAVNLVRSARSGASRSVGHAPSVALTWRYRAHCTVNVVAARFYAGPFLREAGAASDVTYASTWVTYLF